MDDVLLLFFLSLFFFFFNWKHRVLPPPPATETLFPLLFLSPLVCWINHFTPVLNKRTKGRLPLPSDYWFTNRQDVYFLTENSIWNILIMLFFGFVLLFLPLSPLPGFFLREEEDSSETVLISTQHHRHCNKTLEFRETSHTHTHSYTYNICVTISKGSFSNLSLNFLPVQPLAINQNYTELFRGTGKMFTQVHWKIVWSFSGSAL